MNERFNAQGYSGEIHERYQVRLFLPYYMQHVFIYAKNPCGYWRMGKSTMILSIYKVE